MADLDRALRLLSKPDRTAEELAEGEALVLAAIREKRARSLRRDRWQARFDVAMQPVTMVWNPMVGFFVCYAGGAWNFLRDKLDPLARFLAAAAERIRRPRRR